MRLQQFFGPELEKGADQPMKILAVQSSKGGVGKTLLSFLAAQYLRNRDELAGRLPRVVTLDLDFTGTSIPERDGHEREENHTLKLPGLDIPVLYVSDRSNQKPVEILTLFKKYLNGCDIREQISPDEIRKAWEARKATSGAGDPGEPTYPILHITSGEIQVGDNAEFMPNVLFDALHARMLVDFLFDSFGYLECCMRPDKAPRGKADNDIDGKPDEDTEAKSLSPLWIVLDNAPGQSELLPLLQEKLLLWGRHRAKFLHVASLDEMDLDASLRVLAELNDTAHKVHETKRAVPDPRKIMYFPRSWETSPVVDQKSIDHNLFEYVLKGGREAMQAAFCNGEAEKEKPIFAALVVNRVFDTVSLEHVGAFLEERVDALNRDDQSRRAAFLRSLPIFTFRYDPSLALFFQEVFLHRGLAASPPVAEGTAATSAESGSTVRRTTGRRVRPGSLDSGGGHKDAGARSRGIPPADAEESVQTSWLTLIANDVEIYEALYGSEKSLGSDRRRQAIARALPFNSGGHVLRVSVNMCRLLDLCHRLVLCAGRGRFEFVEDSSHFDQVLASVIEESFKVDRQTELRRVQSLLDLDASWAVQLRSVFTGLARTTDLYLNPGALRTYDRLPDIQEKYAPKTSLQELIPIRCDHAA